jgi:hypothetical protein
MADDLTMRQAELRMSRGTTGSVLTARVPQNMSREEFARVATSAYDLVNRLTGCNCMSGRISFVVEDLFDGVVQVRLGEVAPA